MQSTRQLWVVGMFYSNRDYIAKVLCINRDKPEVNCNGHCQLKKELEKNNENTKQQNSEKNYKEIFAYFEPTLNYKNQISFRLKERNYSNIPNQPHLTKGHLTTVFHPPITVV